MRVWYAVWIQTKKTKNFAFKKTSMRYKIKPPVPSPLSDMTDSDDGDDGEDDGGGEYGEDDGDGEYGEGGGDGENES
jgi:hypothetical protein